MTGFSLPIKVLFQHCDPAGIVFYPRYFEMVNQTVETWFDEALGHSFARMHGQDGRGVPTVSIGTEFPAPSRLGEMLDFSLTVTRLGRTSVTLAVRARCGGQDRMIATPTLVHIDLATGRPVRWPEELRTSIASYQSELPRTGTA